VHRPPFLYDLLALILGSLSPAFALLALFFADWARANKGGSEHFFGLSGLYENGNWREYSENLGWNAATGFLEAVGGWMLGLLVIAIVLSAISVAMGISDYVSRGEAGAQNGKGAQGQESSSVSAATIEWALDHRFLLPVLAGCFTVVTVVVWSYLGAPEAFALSRYLMATTEIHFTFGYSFCLDILSSLCAFGSAACLFYIRFQSILFRLDTSSVSKKQVSTYGSIELLLDRN